MKDKRRRINIGRQRLARFFCVLCFVETVAGENGGIENARKLPHPLPTPNSQIKLYTMASANILRRLAIQAASKTAQHQATNRAASSASIALRSIASLSSSSSAPNNGASTHVMSRRAMATISAGDALARLASDHPHQEIIRYEHKNVKWTLKHVNYYSDALACGLVDAGLQPGDVVLSWLPLHFAEQVSLCFLKRNVRSLVTEILSHGEVKVWHILYLGPLSIGLGNVIADDYLFVQNKRINLVITPIWSD
jgi:hypothetical protein